MRVEVGIASIPSRKHALQKVVNSLYKQVDHFYICINGVEEPHDFFSQYDQSKFTFRLPRKERLWLGDQAKFWWSAAGKFAAANQSRADVFLTCDDDILYPDDYVEGMVAALDRHPGTAVGVHGVRVLPKLTDSYYTSLDFRRSFTKAWSFDTRVHIVGTGTLAYRPKDFPELDFDKFYVPNMADIWFAIQAREAGVDLWTPKRPKWWLRPIETKGASISAMKSQGAATPELELLQEYAPWPALPDGAITGV